MKWMELGGGAPLLRLAGLLTIAAWAGGASAAAPVSILAATALDIERMAAREAPIIGDQSEIYFAGRFEGMVSRQIHLRLDDAPPQRYEFSHLEAEALRRGGAFRMVLPQGATAAQRLRVEWVFRRQDAHLGAPPVILALDVTLPQRMAGSWLMVEPLREGGMRGPALGLREGDASDSYPRFAHAQWLLDSGQPYPAAAQLAAMPRGGAGDVLTDIESLRGRISAALNPDAAGTDRVDASEARYLEALAWLAGERASEGVAAMAAIASATADDVVSRVLRDRAQLALAHHYLDNGQQAQAISHFQQVQSNGPHASRALLGLGWAQVLPSLTESGAAPGARAVPLRVADEDLAGLRRTTPFRYYRAIASGEREEDLRLALAAWQELIGRDPLDPAVQEGVLAIPYAYEHLAAHAQAQERYEWALALLQRGHELLMEAVTHVESQALVAEIDRRDSAAEDGWPWWLTRRREARWWMDESAPLDPIFYVEHLLEDDAFRTAVADYRTLRSISARMRALEPHGADVGARVRQLQPQLDAALTAQRRLVTELAAAGLKKRLRSTEVYLIEAHLALARMHDAPPDGRERVQRASLR
jgi:tetratricopeptide (TPR) repeat protein